jgi:RAB protein geranylgeranyltransferase component A
MATIQPYQITTSNQEVIITLNRSLIEQEKLEQFLDYLSIKAIQQKSQLSEESANQLMNEIDNALWENQKGLFEI